MKTFHLVISTPTGNAFAGPAAVLNVRGAEGELAVMAGHVPFATAVKAGECRVELEDGTMRTGQISGGILTVSKEETTLLTGKIDWQ